MNINLVGEKAEAAWKWIWFYSGEKGSNIRLQEGSIPAYLLPVPENASVLKKTKRIYK